MADNNAPRKKTGPKPVAIDGEQVEVLAGMQCTYGEIAAVFGIEKRQFINRLNDEPTLRERVEAGRARGCASIRREQFKLLQAGNATMAVWLGKQYLGQKDQASYEHSGNIIDALKKVMRGEDNGV